MLFRNERISPVRKHGSAGFCTAIFAAVVLLASDATAHSTIKSTTPASGSIVPASPEKISIEFNEAARLIAVFVVAGGAAQRKLTFEPAGSATSFTMTAPQLTPGRNEVRWTALSKDGHPIKGTIIIVVKPGAAPQSPAQKPQQDRGH